MIQQIDLSEGQINILKRVAEIYVHNLGEVYKVLGTSKSIYHDLARSVNIDLKSLDKHIMRDFLTFDDLNINPKTVMKLGRVELIIVQYIIREWAEDEKWHDLEVFGLINKLSVLMELQIAKNKIQLS